MAQDVTDEDRLRSGLGNNNQVFTSVEQALTGGAFSLSLKGGKPSTIEVELVDLYADEAGTKRELPLNSNPYTPAGLVDFKPVVGKYQPSGETRNISIPFRLSGIENITRPVLGGLKIKVVPDEAAGAGLNLTSAIVGTFAYYPLGYLESPDSEIRPELTLGSISFERKSGDLFPFSLIPDFPILFNFGPIIATTELDNTGNIFLDVKTSMSVNETNFFGAPTKDPLLETGQRELFLVPNQKTQVIGDFSRPQTNAEVSNALPRLGIFEVIATAQGSLGRNALAESSNSRILIIFPWKYLSAAILFLGLLALTILLLPTRRFGAFTPGQVAKIKPKQARALKPRQIRAFAPESLRAMRPKALRVLDRRQIGAITDAQLEGLRKKQIKALGLKR